ncbi:hypothetical protein C7B67_29715, partial [filamentous cyanobacterium Phorm 6]
SLAKKPDLFNLFTALSTKFTKIRAKAKVFLSGCAIERSSYPTNCTHNPPPLPLRVQKQIVDRGKMQPQSFIKLSEFSKYLKVIP